MRKYIHSTVYQYDKEGHLIATYPSMSEAARTLGVQLSEIAGVCYNYDGRGHHQNYLSAKGYIFTRVPSDNIKMKEKKQKVMNPKSLEIIRKVHRKPRKVAYVKFNKVLKVFDSVGEAADYFKCSCANISYACRDHYLIKKKYTLRYFSELNY